MSKPTVTALYCTKNEAEFLECSVASVAHQVDEIIIFDTLSTDDTVSIAERLARDNPAIKVIRHPEDFDMACEFNVRNKALSHCTKDWVLALDADQIMSDGWLESVRPIMRDRKCECVGVRYRHFVGDFKHEHKPECGVGTHTWVLFRRTPHLRWRPASEVCDWAKPNHHASAERSCSPGSLMTCDGAAVFHYGFVKENMMGMAIYRAGRGDHGHEPEVKAARVKELQDSGNPFLYCGPVCQTIQSEAEVPTAVRHRFYDYTLELDAGGKILSRKNIY